MLLSTYYLALANTAQLNDVRNYLAVKACVNRESRVATQDAEYGCAAPLLCEKLMVVQSNTSQAVVELHHLADPLPQ